MTIKELAFSAQRHIQTRNGVSIRRAHVYELLAATFGFNSFAAFSVDGLLTGAWPDLPVPTATPELVGRVVQLGYDQAKCPEIALSLTEFLIDKAVSYISLQDLLSLLTSSENEQENDDDIEDWEADIEEDEDKVSGPLFLSSEILMDSLERLAARGKAEANWAIAVLSRCEEPNSYLYDESISGRALTKVEQGWVDEYLQNKPRFEKYRHHLRLAALAGVQEAAIEYAKVFNDHDFFVMAEKSTGSADALKMARSAISLGDYPAWQKWIRIAAEQGSQAALQDMAETGDRWAIRELAESGDIDAIRQLVEIAKESDRQEAWMWLHLSKMLGHDLTTSTLRACHDGGMRNGQDYDDDFGGSLYVDGNEGIQLLPLDASLNMEAIARATALFKNISM